jgi:hypothetical protein
MEIVLSTAVAAAAPAIDFKKVLRFMASLCELFSAAPAEF